jgi:shikimate dehydrogenase
VITINGRTEVYGIIGNPVSHSLSPAMHNRAFAALGLNKVYLPFEVREVADAMTGLRALGIRGASVTIPHKQAVIHHLDEIEPVAARIGAVNTLVIDGPRIKGYNTDWLGANRALAEELEPAGQMVLILGAGGSARAIGFGLLEAGATVVLASRTPERGQLLAKELGCEWVPLSQAGSIPAAVLVNATSVGMAPRQEQTPMDRETLAGFEVVMDIVYAPLETRLLGEARAAGCRVVNGLAMLLYQGAAQFELWTGRPAPVMAMRSALLSSLSG